MRKLLGIISILIISFSFFSCSSPVWNEAEIDLETSSIQDSYKGLYDLPKLYNFDISKKHGDVVGIYGKAYNIEKLDRFIKSFNNNQKDMVRITVFTTEGDAIIKDLIIDPKNKKIVIDNTRDQKSKKEDRKIKEYKIYSVVKKEDENGILYTAKTVNGQDKKLLYIMKKKSPSNNKS